MATESTSSPAMSTTVEENQAPQLPTEMDVATPLKNDESDGKRERTEEAGSPMDEVSDESPPKKAKEDESATESRSKETLTMGSPPSTSLDTKDKVDNKQLFLDAFSRHALLAVHFKRYVADFKCRLAETRATRGRTSRPRPARRRKPDTLCSSH